MQQMDKNASNQQFIISHRFFHQHSIDQLAQPLLSVGSEEHVRLLCGTGGWLQADAFWRHATQPLQQVGQSFVRRASSDSDRTRAAPFHTGALPPLPVLWERRWRHSCVTMRFFKASTAPLPPAGRDACPYTRTEVREGTVVGQQEKLETMHPLAGKPVPADQLIDVRKLEEAYYERRPDPGDPRQQVSFGTSGHRGTSLDGTFTEAHILAITQAICDYRPAQGIDGPLFMGKDTHALSAPAQRTALEVLAANGVETVIQRDDGFTPTPVISRAILVHNRGAARPPGGRDRHHAVAQPAGGRRLQVQPAAGRPRRHRRTTVDPGPRQRAAPRRQRAR